MLPASFRKDDLGVNKIIFSVSILVSAFAGYFLGSYNDFSAVTADAGEISEQKSPAIPEIVKPLPVKDGENNFHENQGFAHQQQSPSSLAATNQISQQQLDAVKTEYEFKQRAEGFTQWLTNNQEAKPWFDLGIEMRGRFDIEEPDYQWALTQESHLQDLFSQTPALAGVALKSAICKSTQCQITISVLDHEHASETATAIGKVLGSEGTTQIIIDNQIQKGEAIFYVARNEKGFELN